MYADGLRTYEGWLLDCRRVVCNGQKAKFYLVNDDCSRRKALFAEDQTEPLLQVEQVEGWTEVVSAEDIPTVRSKNKKPVIRVEYYTATHTIRVWCGPNKKAIRQLKEHNFLYAAAEHRWVAKRPDIDKTIEGLESNGFNVIATVDGTPYETEPLI